MGIKNSNPLSSFRSPILPSPHGRDPWAAPRQRGRCLGNPHAGTAPGMAARPSHRPGPGGWRRGSAHPQERRQQQPEPGLTARPHPCSRHGALAGAAARAAGRAFTIQNQHGLWWKPWHLLQSPGFGSAPGVPPPQTAGLSPAPAQQALQERRFQADSPTSETPPGLRSRSNASTARSSYK